MEKTIEPEILKEEINSDDLSLPNHLEQQTNWDGVPMCLYQGFWCPDFLFRPLLSFQNNFKCQDTDILLASQPKAGTTWLKALLFSIVNRDRIPIDQSPLLTANPHKLVASLECYYFEFNQGTAELENIAQPRLLSTHIAYQVLPSSLINSKCKIVYITRNPLDQFVSELLFLLKIRIRPDFEPLQVDQAFDMFCRGVHAFGPFWDHILGYWKASLENPDRILFLKYEDLKRDPISNIDKIAEFVGLPFSDEERRGRTIEAISNLCSFDKLKNLEINKTDTGVHPEFIDNSAFYRKGEIGDWKNHLTTDMAERLKEITHAKMGESGLNLDSYIKF